MYFDAHVHFFPDFLAGRAIAQLNSRVTHLSPSTDGTLSDTRKKLKEWGCCGGLLLSIATNPRQQKSVNDFAAESQKDGIYAFGSIHPEAEDAIEELQRIKILGLKGVKLHPDYQDFFVDEKRMFPIYEEIERLDLPITFHAGYDPISPDLIHCRPEALAAVADKFPNMRIIAAHMGGTNLSDDVLKYLAGKTNIWFDTAIINNFLTIEKLEEMIEKLGADRILFGTDTPWSSAPKIISMIESIPLAREEQEKIFYKNAAELLRISL